MQLRPRNTALAIISLALYAVSSTWAASATPTLKQENVSLALANELISATLAACRSAVVAVVDRGGNLVAVQRDDSVGPHNTEAAQRKAFTALSTKTPTRLLAANVRANPESHNLNTISSLLLIGGGVPLTVGKDVIGAIGVGGSGGAEQDEGCALKAIAQVLPSSN
ncbi:MAG: heme-binding protein [Candidatus Dechloromonas phosphoritropha]